MHERQRELTDALRLALHSADEDGVSAIAMELGVPEHGADECDWSGRHRCWILPQPRAAG